MTGYEVEEFFLGKSVFISGAGGLIGSVLLEKLIRVFPGIKSIFLLLKSKENVNLRERKERILNKEIFEKLKKENREFSHKVHVIAGDASLSNLGMSEEDIQLLTEEVSIIFHCAATVNFTKSLKYTFLNDVLSLNSTIELGRRMKKLKALVYTSTAYINSNPSNCKLQEKVYSMPFQVEKFLDALKIEDDEKLLEMLAHCKPDWLNTYAFSKCLAENVIMDTASDLPIAIIRPSLVFSTWKDKMHEYEEGYSGHRERLNGAGKSLLKVFYADPTIKLNFVPADIVAKTHVLAAYCVGTKRCALPMIVNCTAPKKFQVAISEYGETSTELSLKFLSPQPFLQSSTFLSVPNRRHIVVRSIQWMYMLSSTYCFYWIFSLIFL